MATIKKVKKCQTGVKAPKKEPVKKEAPRMNFKTSENWADNYSVDTTGLSGGSSNYYPYRRSNGTRGVFTKGETKTIADKVKTGKYKKSDWFKCGGKVAKKSSKKAKK